jgi:hypothetical protein
MGSGKKQGYQIEIDKRRGPLSWIAKFFWWAIAAVAAGGLVYSVAVYMLPGPKVKSFIIFTDRVSTKTTCANYMLVFHSLEALDSIHFEVQFPERIGNHRVVTTAFKGVGDLGKLLPKDSITDDPGLDRYCNFSEKQKETPGVDYNWFDEPASKLVVNANDLSNAIVGYFTIPNMLNPDPLSRFEMTGSYRYKRWGIDVRRTFKFEIIDARKVDWGHDPFLHHEF